MRKPLLGLLIALVSGPLFAAQDGFQREGKDRTKKDALEGKAPPALQVENWINAPNGGIDLASLKGKVVVLDFWGVW